MQVFGVDFAERLLPQSESEWRDRMFAELQLHMPRMQRAHAVPAEFLGWFLGEADSLVANAPAAERESLCERINALLADAGLSDRYCP